MPQTTKCVICLRDICSRTKGMQKEAKTRNFTFFALKTCQSRRQEYPKHKYTKTNKDKDKISPILPERDLPRPLGVAGHTPTNDPSAPPIEELAAADLGVVRVRVESVEGSGATLSTDGVVLQRNVDLRLVLTDVISGNIRQSGGVYFYFRLTSPSHNRHR